MDTHKDRRPAGFLFRSVRAVGRITRINHIVQTTRNGVRPSGLLKSEINKFKKIEKSERRFAHIADEHERFLVSNEANGVTQQDLDRSLKQNRFFSFVYGFLFLAALVWGTYCFNSITAPTYVLNFVYSYILCLLPLIQLLKHLYFYVSIRDERLYNPLTFLKNILSITIKGGAYSVALCVVGYLLLGADAAYADAFLLEDSESDGPVVKYDLFTELLMIMLNGVGPIPESSQVSPWVEPLAIAFMTFNTGLIAIATAWLSYQSVVLTVNSSMDGMPLSQKVHNVWAPMRVTWGLGMMAPVAGGFNAVQMLVLIVAMEGSSLASKVWSEFVGYYSTEYIRELVEDTKEEGVKAVADVKNSFETGKPLELNTKITKEYTAAQRLTEGHLKDLALAVFEKQACLTGIRDSFRQAHNEANIYQKYGLTFEDLASTDPALSKKAEKAWKRMRNKMGLNNFPELLNTIFADEKTKEARSVMGSLEPRDIVRGYVRPIIMNKYSEQAGDVVDKNIVFNEMTPTTEDYSIVEPPAARMTMQRYSSMPIIVLDYGEACGKITVDTVNTDLIEDIKDQAQSLNNAGDIRSAFGTITNNAARAIDDAILHAQAKAAIAQRDLIDSMVREGYVPLLELLSSASGGQGSREYIERLNLGRDEEYWPTVDPNQLTSHDDLQKFYSEFSVDEEKLGRLHIEETVMRRAQILGYTDFRNAYPDKPTLDDVIYERIKEFRIASQLIGIKQDLDINKELKSYGMTTMDAVVEEIKDRGWAAAGAYYTVIAQMNSNRYNMGKLEVSTVPTDYDAISHLAQYNPILGNIYADKNGVRYGVLGLAETFLSKYAAAEESATEALTGNDGSGDGIIEWINSKLGSALTDIIIAYEEKTFRPFTAYLDLVNWGFDILDTIMLTVLLAIGFALTPVGAASGLITKVTTTAVKLVGGPLVNMMMNVISFAAQVTIIALMAIGILHSMLLPMIPYFYMTFAVIGMLIFIAEALVAAPMWMFRHINVNGDDPVGQDIQRGYMIMFNLLLRPVMIIFALVLSYAVFSCGVWLVKETASLSFFAVAGASYGIISSIIFAIVISYLHWAMALQAFGLITNLPDRINRWINENGENLGEDHESQKATNFFVGNVQRRVEQVGGAGVVSNALKPTGPSGRGSGGGSSGGAGSGGT